MKEDLTDEEVSKLVAEMGYVEREHSVPWYRQLKCRLLGPHDWIAIHAYDIHTKDVWEDGMICDVCGKETG